MRRTPALALLVMMAACARGDSGQEVRSSGVEGLPEVPGVEVPEVPELKLPELPGLPDSGIEPPTTSTSAPAAPAPTTSSTAPPATPPPAPPTRTCGPVTLFALEESGGRPSGVAPGDGGSVWFSDPGTGTVGRLDPSGAVTRVPLPSGSQPGAIARAANGDLWYTDMADLHRDPSAVSSVGRVTPSGEVTEFDLPTQESNPAMGTGMGSMPMGITAGPDGAMWFTEAGADQIGRIAPDGTITEFPLPRRDRMHAHPSAITTGPDGAVWFSGSTRLSGESGL